MDLDAIVTGFVMECDGERLSYQQALDQAETLSAELVQAAEDRLNYLPAELDDSEPEDGDTGSGRHA